MWGICNDFSNLNKFMLIKSVTHRNRNPYNVATWALRFSCAIKSHCSDKPSIDSYITLAT